ncbi:MAG TPA: hypothetical protein VMU71_03450, partial [Terracidiphilus sp.]|nr:hypothetical protein [Terracidiphilus sp.]
WKSFSEARKPGLSKRGLAWSISATGEANIHFALLSARANSSACASSPLPRRFTAARIEHFRNCVDLNSSASHPFRGKKRKDGAHKFELEHCGFPPLRQKKGARMGHGKSSAKEKMR